MERVELIRALAEIEPVEVLEGLGSVDIWQECRSKTLGTELG